MPRTVPCLWFDGQAQQAAEHYVSIFPRSEITSADSVMVSFSLDGVPYLALDGGPQHTFNQAVSFQIPCADQDEVDHYWDRLADGGEEGACGWVKDRFGVWWQVVPTALPELLGDPDPGRARRATEAMLGMKKIDVAQMRRAADAVPA